MLQKIARRGLLPVTACLLLVAAVATTGMSAANDVPTTGAGERYVPVEISSLAPPECAGMQFDNFIDGTLITVGTSGNDLMIGGPLGLTLNGGDGDDCIVGGGAIDVLSGDRGNDVIIGGPGVDTCNGNAGTDRFYGCEIILLP